MKTLYSETIRIPAYKIDGTLKRRHGGMSEFEDTYELILTTDDPDRLSVTLEQIRKKLDEMVPA